MTFKAHFDGRVVIPDEPVNLPPNTPVQVILPAKLKRRSRAKRREAILSLAGQFDVGTLTDAAFDRETIYGRDRT